MNHIGTEEILSYLSGKMPRSAMHALERKMVDDDLLADAVEGFRLMRESHSDEVILKKLRNASQFQQKTEGTENAKVVSISKFRWASLTAAACLILAAGFWIFKISNPSQNINSESVVKTMTDGRADSVTSSVAIADAPASAPKENETTSLNESTAPLPRQSSDKKEVPADLAVVSQTEKNAPADAVSIQKMDNLFFNQDTNSQPIQSKRMTAAADVTKSTTIEINATDTSMAAPSGSWKSYVIFLKNIITKPENNMLSTATFTVSTQGKIESINIDGGYSNEKKKEFEKALQTGPEWINKTGKPAKATIQWR